MPMIRGTGRRISAVSWISSMASMDQRARMEDEDRDTSVYDMEIRTDGVITASNSGQDYIAFQRFLSNGGDRS